ncbi:NADPH dehydrogenase [Serratia fonticola]|uniref:NADPH dehydrogenase n=1 Tax=Serratia fonticola TaxID=47917 RepID=A0A4U9VK71_SERFO|nr:NADPH dehydrogenase [Serratia fonticola]
MSLEQIEQLKAQFVAAARRADRLGFDLIELHGAHGYLLHQFLSPLANQRTDQYGGCLQNRMRLLLEIFSEVRAVFPANKALGVRISASDWVEGGWNEQQSVELTSALKELGCDLHSYFQRRPIAAAKNSGGAELSGAVCRNHQT